MYYIEKYDSRDGPRFRIKAGNGKIIAHSEAYSSKRSRDKTVEALSTWCGMCIKDEKGEIVYI